MTPTSTNKFKLQQIGFSLLEVMIAIVVLSLIMITVIQMTDSSQSMVERVTKEDQEYLSVEKTFARLNWDIAHLSSPLYFTQMIDPSQSPSPEVAAQAQKLLGLYNGYDNRFNSVSYEGVPIPRYSYEREKQLTIFTQGNRRQIKNQKQSIYAWVRYEVISDSSLPEKYRVQDEEINARQNSNTPTSVLVRKVVADDVFNLRPINWEEVRPQILMRGVKSFKAFFWNRQNRKWAERLETPSFGENLIRGVKIILERIDSQGEEYTYNRIFRPLHPFFDPENLYLFLKSPANGGLGTSTTNNTQNSQPDSDDFDDGDF